MSEDNPISITFSFGEHMFATLQGWPPFSRRSFMVRTGNASRFRNFCRLWIESSQLEVLRQGWPPFSRRSLMVRTGNAS
ncbi:MAG TPA: hypothetical protein DDX92_04770, partial [Flavobacteriales bacterium]|nr:hypothetical protein [Flavobacteriales bacterium]